MAPATARGRAREELHDLLFDPMEAHDPVDDPDHADVLAGLCARSDAWMEETDDSLLLRPVPALEEAGTDDQDGLSAAESPSHEHAVR